jgi:two-component system, NtrC family, sensor kinase
MMGIVSTIPEKCKRCYSCVRECPAKAIQVLRGQATVIAEQCIACGNCVRICAQKAKRIEDSTMLVKRLLEGEEKVFALLAPSFPLAFQPNAAGKVISALRKLGFSEVWEVAFGAELISKEYGRIFKEAIQSGKYVISTPCPSIVSYVEKYMPSLHSALAPIVSPMLAVARTVRHHFGSGVRVVFIGPCIAKKAEIKDPFVQGIVDAVLTFVELERMFAEAGVEVGAERASGFDGPLAYLGRAMPITGGLLRTAGLYADILENDVLVTEGKDRVLQVLKEIAEGRSKAKLFDLLFCEGCINGPKLQSELSVFARKEALTEYIREQNRFTVRRELMENLDELAELDLSRDFTRQAVTLANPTEEQIADTMKRMRKFRPEDQLNCGSCGYPSCRDKAIAVCQGLAEIDMCLPYLVDELETTLGRLKQSHRDLESTQSRLVQTERLASMGQISAGVAHEINNPLSTILLYVHTLLRRHREEDADTEDLEMILSEATRCRNIMRGLLDFARQSRVVKTPTDMRALIEEVVSNMTLRVLDSNIRVRCDVQPDLPMAFVDGDQIRQMLVNLVQNGMDAIDGKDGEIVISSRLAGNGVATLEIAVSDTGAGMPQEVMAQIFTPFYTTKQLGKGTGMGLSIVYGVVKMHSGEVTVDSEVGKGTTFTVRIPVEDRSSKVIVE